MSNIFKNTIIYTVGTTIPKAANFILLPIYTMYLTTSDYGIIESVMAISPILIILFSLGMGASVFRLYYDYNPEEQKTFFSTIFISTILVSTVFLLLILLFRNYFSQIYSAIPFYPYFLFVILTTFISNFFDLPQKYLMLKEKPVLYIALSLLRFALNAMFILFFIIKLKGGAEGYLKAGVISSLILLPAYLFIIIKTVNFRFSVSMLKNVLLFSLPIIPTLISAWVLDLSDRIFIERYFTLSDVGVYSLAYKIASVVLIVVTSFNMAYRPFFFKFSNDANTEYGKEMIFKYNYLFVLLFILFGFVVSFFSKEVIILLFKPSYLNAYLYIPYIVLSYLLGVIGGLINRFFEQSKKMKVNMYIYLGIAGLNLLLNYILIPKYGAYGAVFSTIISLLIGFVIGYFYAKKHCYFVRFDWKRLIKNTVLLLSVYFLFAWFIRIDNIYYTIIIKILVSSLLMVALLRKHYKDYRLILLKKKVD